MKKVEPAIEYELFFDSWTIEFDRLNLIGEPRDKPYKTHAFWHTEKLDKDNPLTKEHRHEAFTTIEEAIAWCREQEKL